MNEDNSWSSLVRDIMSQIEFVGGISYSDSINDYPIEIYGMSRSIPISIIRPVSIISTDGVSETISSNTDVEIDQSIVVRRKLYAELRRAIEEEKYELAAVIRDEIKKYDHFD